MMLWRGISGLMAVVIPDSWKAALQWSCSAGIFGPKLLIVEGTLAMSGLRRSSCAVLNCGENQGAGIVEQSCLPSAAKTVSVLL